MTAGPIAIRFLGHKCIDDLTTEGSFVLRAASVIAYMCLAYFFDVLPIGVCTARHWQIRSTGAGIK